MTIFNHFARKEDMFFDRDEEAREVLREALRERDPEIDPIDTAYERLSPSTLMAQISP